MANNSTSENSSPGGRRRLRFLLTKAEKEYLAALNNYTAANPIEEEVTIEEGDNSTNVNSTDQNETNSGNNSVNAEEDQNSNEKNKTTQIVDEGPKIVTRVVCMAFSKANNTWDENMCQTNMDIETNSVSCDCSVQDSLF